MRFAFLKIESFKKGIAFSSAFNFISKFLLFFQSIVIAYYFGTQAKTDVFFYCFATITLIAVFVNSLDSSVLIPEAMRLKEQESKEASIKFLNFFIYCYIFLGVVITVVLFFFPVKAFVLLSKFNSSVLEQNQEVLLFSIPLFAMMIVTNLLVNILISYKFFTMPMIVSAINGGLVLLSLFLFHSSLNMLSVLVGQLVAYTFNVLFLLYLMKKNLHWDFSFQWVQLNKGVFKNIFFAQAGNLTSVLASYVPIYLLSGFGQGVITSLTFGQKTAEIPNQILTLQFSSIVAIKFNELYAKREFNQLNVIFLRTARLLLFILLPLSCFIFLYASDIISILFERGFFNATSVKSSTIFLKYFGFALSSLAINTLVARLFMAAQKNKEAVVYQVLLNGTLLAMIIFGVRYWGIMGYLYSMLAVHVGNLFLVYFLLRRVAPFINYETVLQYIIKLIVINGCITLVIFYLKQEVIDLPWPIINLLIGGSFYVLTVVIASFILKLNDDFNSFLQLIPGIRRNNKVNIK